MDIVVIALAVLAVGIAIRTKVKSIKNGSCCSGSCKGCSCACKKK